ncbi:hypothetical protein CCR80_02775 [Rhodothalassium salexigens]|uniref:glycosyltransferase family 2 protein n=1 Tax=Rhodothalassium salexigens TaxID=1086 RepID=UPI00191312F4|nr:glycosyltransferase [Rhodothalassium salexigens]MBK5919962.1 hypothetical protein [Rhodothalassium salexigens]
MSRQSTAQLPSHDLTVAMPAYNAASTVAAALRSVCDTHDGPILLVDDRSADDTVARARAVVGARLHVVTAPGPRGVARARALALAAIDTPYGLWLDADDLMAPGRPQAVRAALDAGADLVYDAVTLIDAAGRVERDLPMPAFLHGPGRLWRQVERNWLNGLFCGFRTDVARRVGYDPELSTGEDYRFCLDALMAGARIALLDRVGVFYRHGAATLSRNLAVAQANVRRVHRALDGAAAEAGMARAGLPAVEIAYTRAAAAVHRGDAAAALAAAEALLDGAETIAPYGHSADWMGRFLGGTALLALDRPDAAAAWLRAAVAGASQAGDGADVHNNLGVAAARAGDRAAARRAFAEAAERRPGYVDAAHNARLLAQAGGPVAADAWALTRLPLRTVANRDRYDAAEAARRR